jgi:hypothetical protein
VVDLAEPGPRAPSSPLEAPHLGDELRVDDQADTADAAPARLDGSAGENANAARLSGRVTG